MNYFRERYLSIVDIRQQGDGAVGNAKASEGVSTQWRWWGKYFTALYTAYA